MNSFWFKHMYSNQNSTEQIQAESAYEIASLILYGTEALPIRLKILLDKVLSKLPTNEINLVLHHFGWTIEELQSGYKNVFDSSGNVLKNWSMITKEEESIILQQFLRFAETKSIAQNFLLQTSHSDPNLKGAPLTAKGLLDGRKHSEKPRPCLKPNKISHHNNNHSSSPLSSPQPANMSGQHERKFNEKGSAPHPDREAASPTNSHSRSPLSLSPLNKLKCMQPFDYRRNIPVTSAALAQGDIPGSFFPSTAPTSPPTTSLSYMTSPCLLTSASATNHVSSISTNMTSTTNSDFSATDGGQSSDDDTNMSGVINLSQSPSAFALKKVRHLRKSANPMKRRWNPLVLSALATNPSTGKKRVQCHVCLKTFCDKGALKIHFSAVHLREMHKCTVEGCNMMFSSRRSRNRHSANPNPKLHTPNFRRKVNPHDGRSANPYPLLPPTSLSNLAANNVGHGIEAGLMDTESANDLALLSSSARSSFLRHADCDTFSPTSSRSPSACHTPDTESMSALSLTTNKRSRLDAAKLADEGKNGSFDTGINLSLKSESLGNKGVRKRKSLNPTKCAPVAMATSDDDMRFISSDDSSSDTYIDRIDDNGILDKSDDESSQADNEDSKDEEMQRHYLRESCESRHKARESVAFKREVQREVQVECDKDGGIDLSKKRVSSPAHGERKAEMKSEVAGSSKGSLAPNDSIVENPLRHLESLSLGAFTNLAASRNHRGGLFGSAAHPLSFPAPGLGMCLKPPTPTSSITQPSERESNPTKESDNNASGGSCGNAMPPGADIDSGADQLSVLPVYRDASLVGQIEVPVDKENPRRCTACGKIFQNHFGVKTHYQNVHLKLMHKCTVDGCNASFPSKRSRDRHSANLNLHRKLLSTHSDNKSSFGLEKSPSGSLFPFHPGANIRDNVDLFSRLYDPQGLPLSLSDFYGRMPPLGPDGLFASAAAAFGPVLPGFSPFGLPQTLPGSSVRDSRVNIVRESSPASLGTPSPPHGNQLLSPKTGSPSPLKFILEAALSPNENGQHICIYCQAAFNEANVIRDHYERAHIKDMYSCPKKGCDRVFISKKAKKHHYSLVHSPKSPHEISP